MVRSPGVGRLYGFSTPALAVLVLGVWRESGPITEIPPFERATMAAFLTVVYGTVLIYAAPNYAERTTDRIHETPLQTFLYGILATILLVVLLFGLVSLGFFAALAGPVVLLAFFLVQLGFLALGRLLTNRWEYVLAVAVAVAALTGALPWVGPAVGAVLGSLGLGAALLDLLDEGDLWQEEPDLLFGR